MSNRIKDKVEHMFKHVEADFFIFMFIFLQLTFLLTVSFTVEKAIVKAKVYQLSRSFFIKIGQMPVHVFF